MDLGALRLRELLQYLHGMSFPANKEEVASNAESNGAPQDVVGQIRNASPERLADLARLPRKGEYGREMRPFARDAMRVG